MPDGKRSVSGAVMVAVLQRIDRHAGKNGLAIPSIDLMAEVIRVDPRTVRTAIAALRELDLLIVEERYVVEERYKGSRMSNSYKIVWSNLYDYLPQKNEEPGGHEATPSRASGHGGADLKPGGGGHQTLHNRKDEPERETENKNPSPSRPAPASEPTWKDVERELSRLGVKATYSAVDGAKESGCKPADVLDSLAGCDGEEPREIYLFVKDLQPEGSARTALSGSTSKALDMSPANIEGLIRNVSSSDEGKWLFRLWREGGAKDPIAFLDRFGERLERLRSQHTVR